MGDILDYYRAFSGKPNVVELKDLVKAANDWAKGIIPPGFESPITLSQLVALANEWHNPPKLANLDGYVTDKGTSNPLERVKVTVSNQITHTGNDGHYKLTGLSVGNHQVVFTKDGYDDIIK